MTSAARASYSSHGRPPDPTSAAVRPAQEPSTEGRPPARGGPDDGTLREQAPGSSAPGARPEPTAQEKRQTRDLARRDAEVRAHEQAHAAAGGAHAGHPSYQFEVGPDGRRYAVGGEVSIDTSPVSGDPEATIQKMQQVRRAALAPAQPSAQDRRVAARAGASIAEAQRELLEQEREGSSEGAQGVGREGGARAAASYRDASGLLEAAPRAQLDITSCSSCGGSHSAA
ncbi:MAG: putative metalloprotease CJM1_0395 family protein [Myxococcales bacterium]|nr:putative metalloprotease CJM1_0395 family protein [Myxococcales bacterium]